MAAVAVAQVNGLVDDSRPASPLSTNSSSKRKRDEDGDDSKPAANGTHSARDEKALIRDYFDVLRR